VLPNALRNGGRAEVRKAIMLRVAGEGEDAVISGSEIMDQASREKEFARRTNEKIQGRFLPLPD